MPLSSALRFLAAGLVLILGFQAVGYIQPMPKTLTPEQSEKLRERDRFEKESTALEREGKLVEAIAAAEKMLALERDIFGDPHRDVVASLKLLARMHERLEDFAAADKARQEVQVLQTKLHGDKAWQVTDARLDWQHTQTLKRMDVKVRQELKESEQWMDKAIANNKPGQYQEGAELAVKALHIRVRLLGEDHRQSGLSAYWAGFLWSQAIQLKKARPYYEQALAIYKKVHGDNHPSTAASLNSLGYLLSVQGDYAAARSYLEQALAIRKKVLEVNHPDIANSLNNLGRLLFSQGDYAAARPYFEQALVINKKTLGDNHPSTALSLNNLGRLLHRHGDYAGARPYYEQALAIYKKVHGDNHPSTAASLNSLGGLLLQQGDYAGARPYYEQALAIYKKVHGDNHPDTATSLNNVGLLLYSQGDFAAAQPYYKQALAIDKKFLGDNHPNTVALLNNLGLLLCKQGNYAAARPYLEQALVISQRSLELAALAQSERQQLAMSANLRYQFHNYLTLPCDTETNTIAAYNQVLAWKGSVLARQQRLRLERQHPRLTPLLTDLRTTSRQLANLAFAVPDPKKRDVWNKQLEELSERKENLERELADQSQAFRMDKELQNLTAKQLLQSLPIDTALIDFLVYRHDQADLKQKGRWTSEERLAAFILKSGSAVVRLDLGPMVPIEKAIDLWRGRIKERAIADADHPGMQLRKLLWLPLQKHLAGTKTVLISPDGALGRLPFAALPGSKEGSYLLEEVALSVIPVPRLLPELLDRDTKKNPLKERSLLLVGDVDFDADAGGATADSRIAATGNRTGERRKWQKLKATKGEILYIGAAFQERFSEGKLKILRGGQATEASIRELSSKYSYLHFATHGFFAPPTVRSALAGDEPSKTGGGDRFGGQGVIGFHPGLMSGLVFAGANRPQELSQSDGILTALEIAELDLSKVDLAVLSACQTGLGKEAAGEGILGLQRAFQVAGAKSVVASLWNVEDNATRVLMESFYENLWEKKMSKQEALRQAQLAMLHGELGRGFVPEEQKQNPCLPPHFWAAFVISGDWR